MFLHASVVNIHFKFNLCTGILPAIQVLCSYVYQEATKIIGKQVKACAAPATVMSFGSGIATVDISSMSLDGKESDQDLIQTLSPETGLENT